MKEQITSLSSPIEVSSLSSSEVQKISKKETSFRWKDLKYWQSGEYQVVQERLSDLLKAKKVYNPSKKSLFKSLDLVPYEKVSVMFCGQDPYPDHGLATGLAFSIPLEIKKLPPTLSAIFDEYEEDLHYPRPATGDLTPWAEEGVLLWNVIPSCTEGLSMSHDWEEWDYLTMEIIEKLAQRDVTFVFLGGRARAFRKFVPPWNAVLEASHPSPRGNMFSKSPFRGSRIFTRTNDALVSTGNKPINWRLP